MNDYLALAPIILPILGALATLIIGKYSEKVQDIFLVSYSIFLFIMNAAYLVLLENGRIEPLSYGPILLDGVGMVITCLICFIGTLVIFYSFSYKDKKHYDNTYFIAYLLLIGMMSGLANTYNVIVMLVFLEAATVISAVLILFGRTKKAIKATMVYLAISIVEVILVIYGSFILFIQGGTLNLLELNTFNIAPGDQFLLAMLFFFGFGTKAGLIPLGLIWLPSAHAEAPPPISATMSGILVKSSVIAVVKAIYIFYPMIGFGTIVLIVAGFGILNILIGVIMAILQEDIKRLLAYHTISQIGYIIVGLGIATPDAVYGALFHITNHMLFKGCLFLITGAIILRINKRKIHQMGGLLKQMPLTAICFLIASLAMSGFPLLNGSVSKAILHDAAIEAGYPLFATLMTIGSVLTFLCLIHAFYVMFMGKPVEEFKNVSDPPAYMMIPILILTGLCIVLGLYPDLLSGVLEYSAHMLSSIARP
ncbi:oxidoreductase [Methanocella sp. CWC-04]|uniref:Oxidoreductase n=1 Tax=Methanooceanicella nereidis TaxID=2052831 RepID=A0AAP2W4M3_9EURY|nr:proton-conducting transporter membrane subunit [Methanocella sp. CWC-04]MCD1294465.1 oxidoreductase [Methanocella sp. CWC-04]